MSRRRPRKQARRPDTDGAGRARVGRDAATSAATPPSWPHGSSSAPVPPGPRTTGGGRPGPAPVEEGQAPLVATAPLARWWARWRRLRLWRRLAVVATVVGALATTLGFFTDVMSVWKDYGPTSPEVLTGDVSVAVY